MSAPIMDTALQEKLRRYIDETPGMNQCKFSDLIGKNNSTSINQYLKGVYPSPHRLEPQIREYFQNIEEAREQQAAIPSQNLNLRDTHLYLRTSISESIYSTIRSCHISGDMAVIRGDAGIGKTRAAQKYIKDYATAIYVVANDCTKSVGSMMKVLCRALGLPTGRNDEMWFAVSQKFSGEPQVLIIDEAQHLPIVTVDNLRQLRDDNPNLGLVFIGNHRSVSSRSSRDIENAKTVDSRVVIPMIYKSTAFTKDDIAIFFPALEGCDESLYFLLGMARDRGIRHTINLYDAALRNENTSFDGLVAMAKYREKMYNHF